MKKRVAIALFSFNRPQYLVQTLDSLLRNTAIDDCMVYGFQDGWKNDPNYPYATEAEEQSCKKLVEESLDLLKAAPLKFKEIVTHEDNWCIGRQLEAAKEKLFKMYDQVIFFDEDHIVSKHYIELLLQMHKAYQDAIVGAQAAETRHIPRDATLHDIGITLKQGVYTGGVNESRPGRWRWLAYLMPKSAYEKTKDGMADYMAFIGPSYRNLPHDAVRVKYGVGVTGWDGVMDKFCDDLGIKRIATVIPRGRYIGESGLFSTPSLYRQMGFSRTQRYEFDGDPVENFEEYR